MTKLKNGFLIVEIVGLFLLGAVIAIQVSEWTGIAGWLSESENMVQTDQWDFLGLATRTTVGSLLKYGCIFLVVAFFLKFSKSQFQLKKVGFSLNGKSLRYVIKASIIIFCVGSLIPKMLFAIWPSGVLGEGAGHWKMLNQSWGIEFWIFMLAGSIILPPIFEEIYFRGFAQARLNSKISDKWSLLVVALIFTLFHPQYFEPNLMAILMSASLLFSALVLGYARYHTGSILPGMIAHGMANIPAIGWQAGIVVFMMVIVLLLSRKSVLRHIKAFISLMKS